MAKRTLQAHYFADDKDVFDLLSAARQKLTSQKLIEFARRRGLLLSFSDERDTLIDQIAQLPFGWRELNALIEVTDTADRAERVSSRSLAGGFSLDDIRDGIQTLSDLRSDARGEVFKIEKLAKGLRVSVKYSELDPSKTPLLQRTQRDFVLEFEAASTPGRILVRHQHQARAHEVLSELVIHLNGVPTHLVQETKIELAGIRDPGRRTDFFLRLTNGVKGCAFEDVKAVKAAPFARRMQESFSMGEEDGDNDLDSSGEDGDGDGITPDEAQFIAQVKEIALKGQGILQTPHYTHLAEHNFFVRSIVWTATEKTPSNTRIEFEAGFDQPEEGTGFTYAIRGIYARRGDGEYKKAKTTPDAAEKTRLLRLIEDAARNAMDAIVAEATSASDIAADVAPGNSLSHGPVVEVGAEP